MHYRLRLLTGSGRTLGTIPFESPADDTAIAAAGLHEIDGPVEVWAEGDRAARMLYRSQTGTAD